MPFTMKIILMDESNEVKYPNHKNRKPKEKAGQVYAALLAFRFLHVDDGLDEVAGLVLHEEQGVL